MATRPTRMVAALAVLSGIVLLSAAPALAVDGVIEINQAKVTAGAGFPFKVSQPGSYRLTSNLTGMAGDAIDISATGVTIDLNGFTITAASGNSGIGINGQGTATVANGSITGFGLDGVHVGIFSKVRNIVSGSNKGNGINCDAACVITGNTVSFNTLAGIVAKQGSTVINNTASANGADGIDGSGVIQNNTVTGNGGVGINVSSSTVIANTAVGNVKLGLNLDFPSGYSTNVMSGNSNDSSGSGCTQVSNTGFQLGPNVCNGLSCKCVIIF